MPEFSQKNDMHNYVLTGVTACCSTLFAIPLFEIAKPVARSMFQEELHGAKSETFSIPYFITIIG